MSFFDVFDNTKSGREQAKHRNRLARYRHFQNANKYANKTKAFKTGEEERVAGTQRNMATAHRKVLAIRGQVNKKNEEAYIAYSKSRRGPGTGRSTRYSGGRAYEQLLNTQAKLENAVSLAAGESLSLQKQAIGRADLAMHRKNVGALGIPAAAPLMEPYQKENKFMTFMNATQWAFQTGANIASAGQTMGLWK
tara:strand:+ start:48 stop:629 length:582 start_codon:yes stop_codon:yes gene_type:complete